MEAVYGTARGNVERFQILEDWVVVEVLWLTSTLPRQVFRGFSFENSLTVVFCS